MSDLRFDPVFNQWSAVAEIRRDRPLEFVPLDQILKPIICPFCRGNEDETPPPLAVWDRWANPMSETGSGHWSARVIPNKFPTYETRHPPAISSSGPFATGSGAGSQDLIIPTPRHVCSLSELEADEMVVALIAAQHRIRDLRAGAAVKHAMFFKNCRHEAGASIEHTHFQLLGSPLISPCLAQRAERFAAHQKTKGQTLLETIVDFEGSQQTRVIAHTERWLVFCPFASRMAFQIWIAPKQRPVAFADCDHMILEELARISRECVSKLEALLGRPAYNWMLHQLPFAAEPIDHWFVELIPRISKFAGYEMGTDIWVNTVAPETAAKRLR